jgi:Uma2 family endonuclease
VANVFGTAPDLAVKIVSPEQSTNALVRRCLWYVENGVDTALLVDPADRSVARFVQDQTTRVLRADDRIEFGSVLPDFTIGVSELFRALRIEP